MTLLAILATKIWAGYSRIWQLQLLALLYLRYQKASPAVLVSLLIHSWSICFAMSAICYVTFGRPHIGLCNPREYKKPVKMTTFLSTTMQFLRSFKKPSYQLYMLRVEHVRECGESSWLHPLPGPPGAATAAVVPNQSPLGGVSDWTLVYSDFFF